MIKQIRIQNLTKMIRKKTVLDHVDVVFTGGNIYGLYGRNGCGKTMLLRAICGLIYPTEGEILFDDKVLHKDMDFPDDIGVVIENVELLPQYDAYTNLKLLAEIKGKIGETEIKDMMERIGLDPDDRKKAGAFSLGMKQKLAIAQAMMEEPDVLLLDEPTNGLDEESVYNIRQMLLEEKERGCIILLASHNKEDLSILADHIVKMEEGKIEEIKNGKIFK